MIVYLLDTNIVSMLDPRRHRHAPALIDWLGRNGASLFLSVMTITEQGGYVPRSMSAPMMEAATAKPVPIEPGTESVDIEVQVTWELK